MKSSSLFKTRSRRYFAKAKAKEIQRIFVLLLQFRLQSRYSIFVHMCLFCVFAAYIALLKYNKICTMNNTKHGEIVKHKTTQQWCECDRNKKKRIRKKITKMFEFNLANTPSHYTLGINLCRASHIHILSVQCD